MRRPTFVAMEWRYVLRVAFGFGWVWGVVNDVTVGVPWGGKDDVGDGAEDEEAGDPQRRFLPTGAGEEGDSYFGWVLVQFV